MKPRVLFAGLFHETHTFVDGATAWSDFEVTYGDAILEKLGDASPTDGFLSTAAELGFEIIPTVDARATPSGIVEDEAFDEFWREFVARAAPALAAGVDAIYLVLHGAMVTQSLTDPEGVLLERIRALPGAATVPIFGVFDLHANLTAKACALANGLVAYRENPHTDARESAVRAARLLGRALREKTTPRMAWHRVPIVWAPPGTGTATEPMLSLECFARELESTDPTVWACNIAPGFSFADTPDTGLSLSLIHTGNDADAQAALARGAALAWSLREQGNITYPPVDDVVAALPRDIAGPVLLVEPADNIGGGAPGDGTSVLRALLKHATPNALVCINDPAAVTALASLQPGETKRIAIGGRGSRLDPGPVEIDATLVSRSDGQFELVDKHSHLASMNGMHIAMGPSAVVRSGAVTVLLTSRKTPPFDLGQYRSQGIEPKTFSVIGVKAAVAHRRGYDPITKATHYVDTPGPCTNNLVSLPWRHLSRPVYPLDPITEPQFIFA
ncbi:MAG: M81 family metallopeptidase [Opitutaceae bacterium]|nr:M81 family metallopeptidase [Opitutaceae bacterium]